MTDLALAARAALIVVMVVAALGKLRRPGEVAAVMQAMGVPRVRGAGVAVGLVELACAALLVVAPTPGFVLALALLVAFTAGLVSAIRRGARVACHCFGASATPIGPAHVVRNVLLMAIAAAGCAGADGEGATVLAGAAGSLVGVVILAWDEVVDLLFPA